MSKKLPFRATTASGKQLEFEFPLHPETASSVKLAGLLTTIVNTLDREIAILEPVGNGDVLQALAMALAVRTRMLDGDGEQLGRLAMDLLDAALASPAVAAGIGSRPERPPGLH